jgi:hypothetical protein
VQDAQPGRGSRLHLSSREAGRPSSHT